MADKTPDTSNSSETLNMTFESLLSLLIIVASFMYIYDALTRETMLDVMIAVLIFGIGLVWLFSNIWRKK
ncbi:MAG: hypothetical protein JW772_02085 [Candidatus Diapherotrites archaeon]|nr:hypothetical protein [Candidatus Diapherotrites archaeon]